MPMVMRSGPTTDDPRSGGRWGEGAVQGCNAPNASENSLPVVGEGIQRASFGQFDVAVCRRRFVSFSRAWLADTRQSFLPLPPGEGRRRGRKTAFMALIRVQNWWSWLLPVLVIFSLGCQRQATDQIPAAKAQA